MNYLAHIYLSGDDQFLKIGNFVADSVKGKKFLKYPKAMQRGIILHRAIDTYTDSHSIVRKSISRLFPRHSHYSGVIVDILYDHYLAKNWKTYHNEDLDVYVDDFYKLLQDNFELLPKRVQNFYPFMVDHNWLYNYRTVTGINEILRQMNVRTKGRGNMHLAMQNIEADYDVFETEFTDFFNDLETYVKKQLPKIKVDS